MTQTAVLSLIDSAQPFVDQKPLEGEELRRAGLAALDEVLTQLRSSEGDVRLVRLQELAEKVGSIIGAGAVNEPFAKAAIESAAAEIGFIRDAGAKPVRSAIAGAIKVGKKTPRAFHRPAAAVTDALQSQPRPGEAGNSAADRISSSPGENVAVFPPDRSDAAASFVAAPAPPDEVRGEKISSQTGARPSASAGRGSGGDDHRDEGDDERHMRLAFFPLTDLGNAERFRERYRDRLLWNAALGWLAWDGKRWSRDGAEELVKIAEHETVRAIQLEAAAVRSSGRKDVSEPKPGARDYVFKATRDDVILYSDKIAAWGRSSEAVNKLGALSKRGAPYLAIPIEKLDADKMRINVNNGTLVVRRRQDEDYVEFRPHDPADLITKLAPVDYDPAASCPEYDKFLARVQPSAEMRIFLHQWLGLSLTGDVSEQKLAFLYGKGSNGKSVLIDAVSYVAGDYGETVAIETFLDSGKARSGGQATPDLAILPGVRMLRTSEPEKNSKLAEAMIKLVTGGEPIQARHLNRDFFKFYPQFKLTISGNYKPSISGADEGIWRRVQLVPFDVFIPKEERDVHLGEKLRLEASGILNRLLDGLRSWCDHGLTEPEPVKEATAQYRSASDPLGRFLSTCVVASQGDRVQSSVLHEVYVGWCRSSGEKEWSNRGLSLAMDERGFRRKQSDVVWWLDIKLVKTKSDFVDAQGHPLKWVESDDRSEREDPEM